MRKKKRRMQERQRSFGHTEPTGCRCRLWHKRAGCRHEMPPRGATNTQRVLEGRGESGRR